MSESSPFLRKVAQELLSSSIPLHQVLVILPNRRGELYLKKYLTEIGKEALLSPKVMTIEEWVVKVSGLRDVNGVELYIKAFQAYQETAHQPEPFETFVKWISTVLHDFNEVDRHLVNADELYQNLFDAKRIEAWEIKHQDPTEMMKTFLRFWDTLRPLYEKLREDCLKEGCAWQGLAYRQVAEHLDKISDYHSSQQVKKVYLAGFNALNNAEEVIFESLVKAGAEVLWDADQYYLNNLHQEAGNFLRKRLGKWKPKDKESWISDSFNNGKNIQTYGVAGAVNQAKKVGEILQELSPEERKNAAVVLADENLLIPILNGIPEESIQINVTMGVGIHQIPICHFVPQLFLLLQKLQRDSKRRIYYKDLKSLFEHKVMATNLQLEKQESMRLFREMTSQNLSFITIGDIEDLEKELGFDLQAIKNLFHWESPEAAIAGVLQYFNIFVAAGIQQKLEKETVYQMMKLLRQLQNAITSFKDLSFEATNELYRQLSSEVQLSFFGEPLGGLQVMGLLETRTLDFDTVIMTSVNEGTLPSGKSQNSFIPFDLRSFFGLPSYAEKDAVYAYHFYRLLQRAEAVHLVYSTVSKGLGSGEKSRFIYQLEQEYKGGQITSDIEDIRISEDSLKEDLDVHKGVGFENDLRAVLEKGLSPTSFSNYIRNPKSFYTQKILGVREEESLEEIVDYSTLGTVVHAVLENFYEPFIQSFPRDTDFKSMHHRVAKELEKEFEQHFRKGRIKEGKNLLIFNVAKTIIHKFLYWDEKEAADILREGGTISIVALEKDVNRKMPIKELDLQVNWIGKVDRLDRVNDTLRIIDYKTGVVEVKDVSFEALEEVVDPELDKGKALQLLLYAYMLNETNLPVQAGIISLRKLKDGVINVQKKVGRGRYELVSFDEETMKEIETLVIEKIKEMFDMSIPIIDRSEILASKWK